MYGSDLRLFDFLHKYLLINDKIIGYWMYDFISLATKNAAKHANQVISKLDFTGKIQKMLDSNHKQQG